MAYAATWDEWDGSLQGHEHQFQVVLKVEKSHQVPDDSEEGQHQGRSIHNGRDSCLLEHKEVLLKFIFELREQGMAVLVNTMVVAKASQVSESFNWKGRHVLHGL